MVLFDFFSKKIDAQLASVVDNDAINLLNLESGSQLELKDTFNSKCCSFDSTGRHLVVGNSNGIIDIFDFKSQTQKRKQYKLQPEYSGLSPLTVNCISWSKNDRYISTGNSNGSIILFNTVLTQMSKPWNFTPFKQERSSQALSIISVTAINYSSLNTSILGAAYDEGSVALWDANKELMSGAYKTHNLPCTSLTLSPVSQILMVSAGIDGLIVLYDLNSKKSIKTIEASKTGITSLDLYKNGYTLCVGSLDGHVHMFDLRHCDESYKSFKAHDTSVNCIKFLQNINNNQISSLGSISSINNLSSLESTLPIRHVNYINGNSLPSSNTMNSNECKTSIPNSQSTIKKSSLYYLI